MCTHEKIYTKIQPDCINSDIAKLFSVVHLFLLSVYSISVEKSFSRYSLYNTFKEIRRVRLISTVNSVNENISDEIEALKVFTANKIFWLGFTQSTKMILYFRSKELTASIKAN